jgi:hypothetical protein
MPVSPSPVVTGPFVPDTREMSPGVVLEPADSLVLSFLLSTEHGQ